MMLCGQASGTVAFVALEDGLQPRRVAEVQRLLLSGAGEPGVLLWPYHDLPPEHPAFLAANVLSLQGIWKPDPDSVFFRPDEAISAEEWTALRARAPVDVQKRLPDREPATRAAAVRLVAAETP